MLNQTDQERDIVYENICLFIRTANGRERDIIVSAFRAIADMFKNTMADDSGAQS